MKICSQGFFFSFFAGQPYSTASETVHFRFPQLFLPPRQRRSLRPYALHGAPAMFGGRPAAQQKALPKNAVVVLNELKPGLKYEVVDMKGPSHLPVFVVQVTINGQTFMGEGR